MIDTVLKGTAFGGIIAIVMASWNTIKMYASKITSLLIVRIIIQNRLDEATRMFLFKEFTPSRLGKKLYGSSNDYVRPLNRNQLVGFEQVPIEPTLWWKKGKFPILVSQTDGITISFIRGTYNKDQFIIDALESFNSNKSGIDWRKNDRYFIRKKYGSIGEGFGNISKSKASESGEAPQLAKGDDSSETTKFTCRPLQWKREELGQPMPKSPIENLSLSSEAEQFVKDCIFWRESENWFQERNIPWKRGALLYGKPGTGKTAFTRAVAQELNMPIFLFDLASMTNKDLYEAWEHIMNWSPAIALFEDIDAIFENRKNIAVQGLENGLTFDSFLNCIDGVANTNGIFTIITTNNIETIDPAIGVPNGSQISSRPGRIDRAIHFDILDDSGREKMAQRILKGFSEGKWIFLLEEGKNDTGAQFQERCCRVALSLWNKEFNKEIKDESKKKELEDIRHG